MVVYTLNHRQPQATVRGQKAFPVALVAATRQHVRYMLLVVSDVLPAILYGVFAAQTLSPLASAAVLSVGTLPGRFRPCQILSVLFLERAHPRNEFRNAGYMAVGVAGVA